MELLFIALRNVFRNKRRTILNVIALAIGMIMIIIGIGWMRGYQTGLFQSMINFETGHLQILNRGYLDEERRLPLDANVNGIHTLGASLQEDDRIEAITPRINFGVVLGANGYSRHLIGRAIQPDTEQKVSILHTLIKAGDYFETGSGVLVSKPLAEKLGISEGSSVSLTAYTKYSTEENPQPNLVFTSVVGIFHYGYPAIDDNVIYTDFDTASDLLLMEDEATKLVIRLKPNADRNAVMKNIEKKLAGTPEAAYPWERFAEVVVSAVNADGSTFALFLLVIYLLIILGVRNAMSMSVQDRTREIGTLRAIGMKRRTISALFLAESVWISLIAAVFGLIVGGVLALFLQYVGFNMGDYLPEEIPIPFGEKFTADFRWFDFVFAVVFGAVTALLAGLAPARRAAKIVIARAMSTTAIK
ncbi:MAG: ABC transporter permease [Spirochaetales bacterium]|nr:ABC transporter permease [Spirochaetales bacterium]